MMLLLQLPQPLNLALEGRGLRLAVSCALGQPPERLRQLLEGRVQPEQLRAVGLLPELIRTTAGLQARGAVLEGLEADEDVAKVLRRDASTPAIVRLGQLALEAAHVVFLRRNLVSQPPHEQATLLGRPPRAVVECLQVGGQPAQAVPELAGALLRLLLQGLDAATHVRDLVLGVLAVAVSQLEDLRPESLQGSGDRGLEALVGRGEALLLPLAAHPEVGQRRGVLVDGLG
mmetsp:Transcript_54415/g.158078  ORF Transcript_54415/g.158078 Transcript_54415/m.158078 type:complete len:231 (+) Transcript_54415:1790-2482(+)